MEENLKRFIDQHVIVTGAGSGIGRGIAHRFASEGAKVMVADVDSKGGEEVAAEIKGNGGTAQFLAVDVSSEESIKELVQKATQVFGPVKVCVSNGVFHKHSPQPLKFPPKNGIGYTGLTSVAPLCSAGLVPTI